MKSAVAQQTAPSARRPRVRRSVFPALETPAQAFASLASLLDQTEDDAALQQHERGLRALVAARQLAIATTRTEENRALAALIAIAHEDLEERK